MSSKQNKRHARTKKAREAEKQLLKTTFPYECEQLPISELKPSEQEIVNKCIHFEELTDEEFTTLKRILDKYRESIYEYKPDETVENAEKVINIINSEQELLDILDDPSRRYLLLHLPLNNKIYSLEFEVLPITDSRAVQAIELHLDLFADYSQREKQIIEKANHGQVLSPEEKQIMDRIAGEIEEKADRKKEEIMITLLAHQLRLPNSSDNIGKRLEFWRKFPFNVKVLIFAKVQDKLGLTEYDNNQLFPTS